MRIQPAHPVVFAYNFPHKKTQDFLQRLVLIGAEPCLVLLANHVELKLPAAACRVKPRHCDLVHPRSICDRHGLRCEVVDHSSDRCADILGELRPELGIVAGARILPKLVIDCFSRGVVNFHPGILPQLRGLDALQWAVHHNLPLGVTAHFVDGRIDAGRIVERKLIDEYADDTLIDLSLRLYETQVQMLASALETAANCQPDTLEAVTGGNYRRSFPTDFAATLPQALAQRLCRLQRSA